MKISAYDVKFVGRQVTPMNELARRTRVLSWSHEIFCRTQIVNKSHSCIGRGSLRRDLLLGQPHNVAHVRFRSAGQAIKVAVQVAPERRICCTTCKTKVQETCLSAREGMRPKGNDCNHVTNIEKLTGSSKQRCPVAPRIAMVLATQVSLRNLVEASV